MYADTIGSWSRLFIAFIAFMCMFGTTLAVLDGYARTIDQSVKLLSNDVANVEDSKGSRSRTLPLWTVAQAGFGMGVVLFFQSALSPMLSFAMTMAFLTTPFFAWLNFSLVRGKGISKGMNALAWTGIVYLSAFSLFYLLWLIWGQ